VERDPLGFGRRGPLRARGGERPAWLEPWLLRLLRIALASSRPRRANLIRERVINAAIEQARYRASGATPFEWIRARWAGHDENPAIGTVLGAIETVVSR
jgi:hypothetical protein